MSDHSIQAPSPEHLAELLPQYGVESFIAQGGMGAVYKATQLSLDRDVAIKVLLYEFGGDAEFRESFTTEAKAMARLNHPNLLGVFDYGDVDGMPYIVMEYVQGGSLHEAAWNEAIEPSAAVNIVKGICDGLAHAHEHSIVHRDIKPSNILLTLSAEPKIADFGLAHAADSEKPGLVMGTPGYTAPEVFQDPEQAGQLADIYSVGVILHQLLTGTDPAGSAGPPTQPTGNLRLDAIWRKATHINPAQRYATVAAMAADLEKWSASKLKAPVVGGAAPSFNTTPRRRPRATASSGAGGLFVKLVVIAILGTVVVFTYQLLEERKEEIKKGIAETTGTETSKPAKPAPQVRPDAAPQLVEPDSTAASTIPDPGLVEVAMREKPVAQPSVDPEPEEELPLGDPELRERARGLILAAYEKRDKDIADNASALVFHLESRARSASSEEAALITQLLAEITDNRIPSTGGVDGLSERIAADFKRARAKEESIETGFRSELTRIRDAYVNRLETAAAEASREDLKRSLLAQAKRAENLDAWIGLLAGDSGVNFVGGFPGKWNVHSYDKIDRWIAHSDGRMEIVGKDWDVTWEILEDGTLEVDWGKKRPYILTRDETGGGWTGKTSFGKDVTLTRGDW